MNPTSEPKPSPAQRRNGFFKGLAAALTAVLALGLVATVVSAQTGDDSGGETTTEDRPDFDSEEFQAYRDCLTENGVEAPADGERPDRDDITDEQRDAFRAAREACAEVHPNAEAIAAARECLAENGVELPTDGERPDRDDITDEQREAIVAAREACADVLPDGGRFGHGPRGPRGDFDSEEFQAYRDCLTENGVEAPADGERPDRDSITDEQRDAFQAAREACADVHPNAEQRAAAQECLAENGIDLDGERPDRDDITDEQRDAFQAAREACADVLPQGGPGGPRGHGPRGPGGPAGDGEQPARFGGAPVDGLTPA